MNLTPKKHQTTFTNNIKKSCFISVRDVLEKRQTSCGSLATVVASVFRNLKIPTKLVHGRYIENNPQMRHAWNEVNFNGNDWVPFDITCLQNGFKLDEFHIKELEAVDWDEFEQDVEKLFQ